MGPKSRSCVVCFESGRTKGGFFASFPKDENRCRKWLRAVGVEDLVLLPIEKLSTRRFVCIDHFTREDFNQKGNRLKQHAIPTQKLPFPKLTDEQLKIFPLHVANCYKGTKKKIAEVLDKEPVIGNGNKPAADPQDEHIAAPPNDANEQPSTETPATQPSHEDDIRSETDSVVLPEAPVEESVVPEPKNFTWQKPNEVVPVPADDTETEAVMDNLSMYCDDGDHASLLSEQLDENNKGGHVSPAPHEVFRCNMCDTVIAGFRYTCVQCSDLDLCGACEAARAHHHHYVLRVPADRLAAEVQLVLAALRRHLLRKLDPIRHLEQDQDDVISLKSEVKSEEEDNDDNDNNNDDNDDDDDDDDGNQYNNDVQNKSHEDDLLNRSTSRDEEVHSVESGDEAPRDDSEETREERNTTKIYLKLADFMKMKERGLPWAQNVQIQYSNEAPRDGVSDTQHQAEEAVVLSETDGILRRQDVNSLPLQVPSTQKFVKEAELPTKVKDLGAPAQTDDLGTRPFKIAGKQSLLKVIGQLDSIAPSVQLELLTPGEQSEIIVSGQRKDVNSLPLQVPNTQKIVKEAELRTIVKDLGAPANTNDLGTRFFKLADKQSLLKVAGQIDSIKPDVQLELITQSEQSETVVSGPRQYVNSRSEQVPSTQKFVKKTKTKIKDVVAPGQINDLGTRLFKIADKQSLLKVAGQLKSIAPDFQLELIAPDERSEIIAGGDNIAVPGVRVDATEQEQPNICELECVINLQRLPSQILANAGQEPVIRGTTKSCNSRSTLPATSMHRPEKRSILTEQAELGDMRHAVPVKKRCFSSDLTVYSYDTHHIMPDCSVRLSRLPDAIMSFGHILSSQTRAPSVDSRDSSDEDNR